MDAKELSNEALEKVNGGFTTSTETDKDGNIIMIRFGVIGMCSSCGECERACPTGSIYVGPDGAEIDGSSCILCWSCADACPLQAIGEKRIVIPAPQAE